MCKNSLTISPKDRDSFRSSIKHVLEYLSRKIKRFNHNYSYISCNKDSCLFHEYSNDFYEYRIRYYSEFGVYLYVKQYVNTDEADDLEITAFKTLEECLTRYLGEADKENLSYDDFSREVLQ